MTREKLLKSVPFRVLVFLWMFAFPLIFIGVPVMEMYTGERERDLFPLWAFGVWILGPWAAMIILKYAGTDASKTNGETSGRKG